VEILRIWQLLAVLVLCFRYSAPSQQEYDRAYRTLRTGHH